MTSPKTFQVHIHRYDPERKSSAYAQTYQVKHRPSMTVLEVLEDIQHHQDSSLAFRSSCRSSKCGTCAVSLDGKPALACRTVVSGEDISLGPLPRRPVVRDLIVEHRGREKRLGELAALERESTPAALPESKIDYANVSRCIECTVCTAACPVGFTLTELAPTPDLFSAAVGAGIRVEDDSPAMPLEENIDYCSLCLNCYLACPAGVDLNALNAWAKDALTEAGPPRLRNWLFGRPDLLGKAGSLAPKLSNLTLANALLRKGMEASVGISARADMPPYESPFLRWYKKYRPQTGPSAERKVAFFVGCFYNYNDTQTTQDTIRLLDHLGVHVGVPEEQQCCGMPMLGNGDAEGARRRAEANTEVFRPWLEKGYDVIVACTTGSLMLKSEYTGTLDVPAAGELAGRTYDLGEYLQLLVEDGVLDLGALEPVSERMSYHTPCHLKAQQIGRPFIELLSQIPGQEIDVLDTVCCGLSGSYGLKTEKYDLGQDIGQHLFDALDESHPDLALSECGPCQLQMRHGTGLPTKHPVSVLWEAMGQESVDQEVRNR
ncbi:MAG: Anaerobic glycerol-3-phosphate dehydrogenase subunit C [Chloroflexi bacterium]|nr:Anaerobic glycerol-3-phosphate dehydrogenase subunit C [Chloroflexota bacterium]